VKLDLNQWICEDVTEREVRGVGGKGREGKGGRWGRKMATYLTQLKDGADFEGK
jgi:hypothetical protein